MKNSLGALPRKKSKPPDDLSKLPMTVVEARRILRRYVGKSSSKYPGKNPKKGEGKSTVIHISDIALLMRVQRPKLTFFSLDSKRIEGKFGLILMGRLINILQQLEAGLITKSQYGVYHFHDEPVVKPRREMRMSFGGGMAKIMPGVKVATYDRLPGFKKLFGEK